LPDNDPTPRTGIATRIVLAVLALGLLLSFCAESFAA